MSGEEVDGGGELFYHTFDGAGDEIFTHEVLAGGVTVAVGVCVVHRGARQTLFHAVADKDHVTCGQRVGVALVDFLHGVLILVRVEVDEVDAVVGGIGEQCTVQRQGRGVRFQFVHLCQQVEVYSHIFLIQLVQIGFCGIAQTVLLVGRDVPADTKTCNDHV